MSNRSALIFGGIFFFTFLFLTPLGIFNSWVPPNIHKGYYSVTTIDAGDDTGYYAYLRSTFFDGDLDFFNESNYAHAEKINPTGYVFNNWQMGQAILFLPFFLIGHVLAHFYQSLGYPITTDGYSIPYYLSTAVASATYLFAGLFFVYRTLSIFVQSRISLLATISIWLASPLIYFSFIRQRMAHTSEFFLAAVLIFIWIRVRQSSKPTHYALIGIILGWLCMIRIINISFFALFAIDTLWGLREEFRIDPSGAIKKFFILTGTLGGFFFITMLPQIYCWYQLNGVPFPPRHMKYAGDGLTGINLGSLSENIYALFFDAKWGLLFSMPLGVLGLMGLFVKESFSRNFSPGLFAYLLGIFGIILLYPEDSASYGHRHLISALPVFAIGLGILFERFSSDKTKFLKIGLFFICFTAILAQYFMLIQYKVLLPYNHPQFTLKAIGSSMDVLFGHPEFLMRSSNFFQILISGYPDSWDYLDGLLLLLFPLLQFVALAFAIFFLQKIFKGNGTSFLNFHIFIVNSTLVSLILVVMVAFFAPTKSDAEILSRLKYREAAQIGESLFNDRQIDASRKAYMEASKHMPIAWKPYLRVGQAWQSKGNVKEANKYFRMALKLNPRNSPTLVLLGNNLNRLGNVVEAEKMLRAAIRSWPMNKYAYDSLAQVLARMDRRPEAVNMLKNAINIDPNYGVGHVNLAMIYSSLNENEKALEHLNRAIRLGIQGPVIDRIKALFEGKAKND